MAWSFLQSPRGVRSAAPRVELGADLSADEGLTPLIMGAYMRGGADTLSLLGIAAVFLDRSGRVLGANDVASRSLRDSLRLEAGHLVAASGSDNAALSRLVDEAVSGGVSASPVLLPDSGFALRALRLPQAMDASPVAAILVVVRADDAFMRGVMDRFGQDDAN